MSPLQDILTITKFATSLLSFIGLSSHSQRPFGESSSPIHCLSTSTLGDVIECLDAYTVADGFYNATTYALAQPSSEERLAWNRTIFSLLSLPVPGNCASVSLPSVLEGIYTITQFTESPDFYSGTPYCIFHEVNGEQSRYEKGWGTFVAPAYATTVERNLHISAPHPAFDYGTPQQAAALFKAVGARSLLIAGRSRLSYRAPSVCVKPNPGTKTMYHMTDPTHNNLEPFNDALHALYNWQMSNGGGCPGENCAFLQLHGKSQYTCVDDLMFISAGLGTSRTSVSWYTGPTPRPSKTLAHNLRAAFPGHNISLPSSSKCGLTATKNVFGRFLNGVPNEEVCTRAATPSEKVNGMFVHVEQAWEAIQVNKTEIFEAWAQALKASFDEL